MRELREVLAGCSGRSAPGPDHITWTHIKRFCIDDNILKLFVWIINTCFVMGFWPDNFKTSKTVIIPKPGKKDYNIPKVVRPIVLLNTLGKLFEKAIANRLQWEAACFEILHPCQFGGVRQNSTEDAGSYLTHLMRAGWTKGYKTSVVAFDLAQYFLSLNHSVITLLLDRMEFADVVVNFFADYLVGRFTKLFWDNQLSEPFPAVVGVGQGSALSLILSALYLAPVLWEFHTERHNAQLISYVGDRTIIVQSKTWNENLVKLKSAYATVFQLMATLGLVLEHDKLEAFHFSRKHEDLNPLVDLGYAPYTGNTPLVPSKIWRYLGIFFDQKLLFKEHSKRYACKAHSAMRSMLSLGNSAHGLKPKHKRLLYRSCVMPIALYSIHLWYYNGARVKGTIKELIKIQRQVAIWILGAFKSTPTGAVESLAGLIPIHLQIQKLVYHNHVRMHTLADSHITRLMAATRNEADFISVYHPS